MTKHSPRHWTHGGFKIAVALVLMGFLPACDRAGNPPPRVHSLKAGANAGTDGKKAAEAFKARHAIFLYRSRPDNPHSYDQPVTEKHVIVLT